MYLAVVIHVFSIMKVTTIVHKIAGGEGKITYPSIYVYNLYRHFEMFLSLKLGRGINLNGLLFHIICCNYLPAFHIVFYHF